MKRITLLLSLSFIALFAHSQNWLKGVEVEIYYISDATDSINLLGSQPHDHLPVGSVTYRIYAHMLPSYKFESVYGNIPHPLSIITSTSFFNDENNGGETPAFTKTHAKEYATMLDSWLSVGAGCNGNMGVEKTDDNGVATVVNANGMLQSTNVSAGTPVKTQDGLMAGSPPAVTLQGFIPTALDSNQFGDTIYTTNGAWAALGGTFGIPHDTNRVLIAQLTTDGRLCFKINLLIGDSAGGNTQYYVWSNPASGEITIPSLTYCSFITDITNPENSSSAQTLFLAYPNPVKNTLALKVITAKPSKENCYTIYDIKGMVVFHKDLGAIQDMYFESLDVSSLAKGEYIVDLFLDGVISTQKVVIN
jgi:hypothetical protein